MTTSVAVTRRGGSSGFAAVVAAWIVVSGFYGCEDDGTFFICPYLSTPLGTCSSGTPDREGDPADGRPESCIAPDWQFIGLGRCETDADCARFIGTALIPAGADPPYSRCVELVALGERFCDAFTGPGSWIDGQCEPGWPCGSQAYDYPHLRHCISQQTRTTGVPAFIVACIPGPPTDLVDPRCGEPRYP